SRAVMASPGIRRKNRNVTRDTPTRVNGKLSSRLSRYAVMSYLKTLRVDLYGAGGSAPRGQSLLRCCAGGLTVLWGAGGSAPRGQSLLRSQARCALLPAPSPWDVLAALLPPQCP